MKNNITSREIIYLYFKGTTLCKKVVLPFAMVTLSLLVISHSIFAEYADAKGDLQIQVNEFSDDTGQAIANLFREGDKIPSQPFITIKSSIRNKTATLIFYNLPYGEYAVIVYHDANSNGTLDHNWMRLPEEQLGFSNGFKIGLTSGMPNFKKLRFVFSDDTKVLRMVVK